MNNITFLLKNIGKLPISSAIALALFGMYAQKEEFGLLYWMKTLIILRFKVIERELERRNA
jgi:hypothetical protein